MDAIKLKEVGVEAAQYYAQLLLKQVSDLVIGWLFGQGLEATFVVSCYIILDERDLGRVL